MRRRLTVVVTTLVVCALPALAAEDPRIKAMADGLRHPDSRVRGQAAMALAEAGPAAKEALPALTAAVEDRNLNVRYWAISAIRAIGPAAKAAVPALVRGLKTFPGGVPELEGPPRYFPDVRAVAAEALGSIGPAAKEAMPALTEASRDENPSVRETAAAALMKIAPQGQ